LWTVLEQSLKCSVTSHMQRWDTKNLCCAWCQANHDKTGSELGLEQPMSFTRHHSGIPTHFYSSGTCWVDWPCFCCLNTSGTRAHSMHTEQLHTGWTWRRTVKTQQPHALRVFECAPSLTWSGNWPQIVLTSCPKKAGGFSAPPLLLHMTTSVQRICTSCWCDTHQNSRWSKNHSWLLRFWHGR